MKKVLTIEGMSCAHCQAKVESALKNVEGVKKVVVKLAKKEAIVTIDSPVENVDEKLKNAVEEVGYSVTNVIEKKGLFS